VQGGLKELDLHSFCSLTAAIVYANFVDSIAVKGNKVTTWQSLGVDASNS
jgi:hypothetical protein